MGKVLHIAIAITNDTYATKSITPNTEAWTRFELYVVGGIPAPGAGYSGDFTGLLDGATESSEQSCLSLSNDIGLEGWFPCNSSNGPLGSVPTPGVWYQFDYRFGNGSPAVEELWIDNVNQGDISVGSNSATYTRAAFGLMFANGGWAGFEFYMRNMAVGTTRGGTDFWDGNISAGLSAFTSTVIGAGQTLEVINDPTIPVVTFTVPKDKHWRYVLTDLTGERIAFWDTQARNREIEFTLNTPTQIRGTVSSDSQQVNETFTDGFPYLTEGDRLLYAFRRDYDGGGSTYPWTCRAAGILLEVNDNAGPDNSDTDFVAYDPWQYLYSLPVVGLVNPLTGTEDVTYTGDLNDIVVDLIQQAHAWYEFANPAFTGIDLAGGTIETLPTVTMTFQRETSIGQCLEQCCAQGCDIVLLPVYDEAQPGVMCTLNVYEQAGAQQPDAIFSWDKNRRSLVNDNRQVDGTQRANNIRFHLQAEANGSEATVTVENAASVTRFGDYYQTQYWPAVQQSLSIQAYADQLLSQVGEQKRTITLGPVPERSPDPFVEYYLGDSVPVYASKKFRATQSGFQRITGFTVEISDNALETIRDLRVYIPAPEPLPPGFAASSRETVADTAAGFVGGSPVRRRRTLNMSGSGLRQ